MYSDTPFLEYTLFLFLIIIHYVENFLLMSIKILLYIINLAIFIKIDLMTPVQ